MRGADVLMAVPPIMLGLLVLAVTPPALWKTALAVGFVYIPPIARVTRSVTLALANEEFIQAAQARAESTSYILFREILPNAWPPLIVEASLRVTYAILLGSALSFLGLGAQPPSSDWGLMIAEARSFIDRAPWIALAPGLRHVPARSSASTCSAMACASGSIRACKSPASGRPDAMTCDRRPHRPLSHARRRRSTALTAVSLSARQGRDARAWSASSGSGKSTVALAVMGLLPAEAQTCQRAASCSSADDILTLTPSRAPRCAARAWRWCSRTRSRCSTRRCASASRSAKGSCYHRGFTRERRR